MALDLKSYSDLILMFYADAEFRTRFLEDPTSTLRSFGVTIPEGVTVKAVVDTRDVIHIVVPERHELRSKRQPIIRHATQLPTDGCHI